MHHWPHLLEIWNFSLGSFWQRVRRADAILTAILNYSDNRFICYFSNRKGIFIFYKIWGDLIKINRRFKMTTIYSGNPPKNQAPLLEKFHWKLNKWCALNIKQKITTISKYDMIWVDFLYCSPIEIESQICKLITHILSSYIYLTKIS